MKKKQTIPELIWQFFCSVKLTVYTLILLAATSVIGTVILQNGAPQQYLKLYGQGGYNLIRILSIDDMYQAWWFLSLLIILCINIVVCSIDRLSVTWKIIFPKKVSFNADRFRKLKNKITFSGNKEISALVKDCEAVLGKSAGKIIKEETDSGVVLYAEKGRWTRIGVYVVHVSIIFLLIGALIGALFGFKASLNLDEGATSDRAFLSKERVPIKLGFSIRCNDFDVKFYDTGAPDEFKSSLTIIENGQESFTKDILVNHPLRYKGINIFQSSYGQSRSSSPESIVIEVMERSTGKVETHNMKLGEKVQLADGQSSFMLQEYEPHFDFKGNNLGQAFVGTIKDNDGKEIMVGLPLRFPTFDKMRKGKFAVAVKEVEQKYFTGLQITRDPGVWYVYIGFILMIIGCWITFFMAHQSFFIEIEKDRDKAARISLSGTTNRNAQGLKLKLNTIVKKIEGK